MSIDIHSASVAYFTRTLYGTAYHTRKPVNAKRFFENLILLTDKMPVSCLFFSNFPVHTPASDNGWTSGGQAVDKIAERKASGRRFCDPNRLADRNIGGLILCISDRTL